LGLVLYELLEGRQFHAGRLPGEILARVVYDAAPLDPEFTVPVPGAVRGLVSRMIRRWPEERPGSMAGVLRALDANLAEEDRSDDTAAEVVKPDVDVIGQEVERTYGPPGPPPSLIPPEPAPLPQPRPPGPPRRTQAIPLAITVTLGIGAALGLLGYRVIGCHPPAVTTTTTTTTTPTPTPTTTTPTTHHPPPH